MKLLLDKQTIYKIIRFGVVGIFNTALDLVVLNGLVALFGVENPFMFSIFKGVSFVCALISSYFLNKYFTFNQNDNTKKVFLVFVFYSLIGFIANVLLSSFTFYLLSFYSDSISIHMITTISGIVGAVVSAVVNYINYSYFVFK